MQVIVALFGLLSLVVGLWALIGFPVGIILGIIYLLTKEKSSKQKLMKWLKISFGGVVAFIGLLILWALINLILSLMGISISVPMPGNV